MHTHTDIAIVGSGLAGLLCAAKIRREAPDSTITLFEASSHIGGKARTEKLSGGHCNLGPHALYRGGPLSKMLGELGVELSGGNPASHASFIDDGDTIYPLPSSPLALLAHAHMSARTKWHLGRALMSIQRAKPSRHARSLSAREWLGGLTDDPHVLAMLEMLLRLSTYSTAFDILRASSAHTQLQRAITGGVRYLDGGWQSIIDALSAPLLDDPRTTLHTQTRVSAITSNGLDHELHTHSGKHRAHAIILATPPRQTSRLMQMPDLTEDLHVTRAACIDMVCPRNDEAPGIVLGLHEPHYYSVHSRFASLVEDNELEVVHAARYIDEHDDRDPVDLLHQWLDTSRPGWRDDRVAHRTSPKIVVMHGLPAVEAASQRALPPGVAIASDWYHDSDELLADAVAYSARRAVGDILTRHTIAHAS